MTCFIIDDDIDDREFFALAVQGLGKSVELHTANDCTGLIQKIRDLDGR